MKDESTDVQNHRASWRDGFLISPSQLCDRAGVNVSLGTHLFGDGKSAKPYVPFLEYLRRLTYALRVMLRELGHPGADQATVIRAYIEAGYLSLEDVMDFMQAEGLEGWMKEADCLGNKLEELSEEGRLVVQEMYKFQLLREQSDEEVAN
jgi:hypothetical protein